MGGDMEDLLMGGGDSSDDSDGENDLSKVAAGTSAVAATIQPTASPTPPQQQAKPPAAAAAAPAPAPPAASQSQGRPASQSELSQRLKSLYSPAPQHGKKQLPPAPAPAPQAAAQPRQPPPQQAAPASRPPTHSTSTSGRSPHHHPGASQPAPAQRGSSQSGRPTQGGPPRSSHPGAPSYTSPSGQPPQQQRYSSSSSQPPQGYQQPPSSYGRSSSQHRPSSSSGHPSSQPPPSMQRASASGTSAGGVPNPVPHGSVPAPGQRRSGVTNHDPFEPTPLHKIKEREQKAAAAAAAAQAASRSGGSAQSRSGGYSSSQAAASSHSGAPSSGSASEREKDMRRQKERFLMFTRVLMKYLETKDPALHQKVKAIIKDCAERNKRQERGYESVTASMRERLKHVVGEAYWKRAESYLAHFLAQKQKQSGGKAGSDPNRQAAEMKRKQEEQRRRAAQMQQAKLNEQRKMQQQQQQQHAQQQAQQQHAAAQQASAAAQPQAAPAPAKGKQAATGGKGKRAGGKQGGKTTKKARTKSATGTGRSSKAAASSAAQSPTAQAQLTTPTSQQSQGQQLAVATTPTALDPNRPPSPPPVRDYNDLMEMVDHAVNFDWTTAGLIMGSSVQKQQLQEEQKNLLYSTSKPGSGCAGGANNNAMDWTPESPAAAMQKTEGGVPFALRGWGKRNMVSPRVAWTRVRKREIPTSEQQRRYREKYPNAPPIPMPATEWVHEDKAEDDPALCLLSEATQIYVTQILQKALVCARQRQNLDGIRLWHQQCTATMEIAKAEKDKDPENKQKPTPPPLSIRLGCDVSRQVARTMGNSALTSKRMEQALERQKTEDMTRVVPTKTASTLNTATLASAQSMGELSLLPPLAKASEKADYEAKRSFEVYGGKHSHEPPFGRVPKKATLEIADFQQGLQLNNFLGGRGNRRHRANPHAFSFAQG